MDREMAYVTGKPYWHELMAFAYHPSDVRASPRLSMPFVPSLAARVRCQPESVVVRPTSPGAEMVPPQRQADWSTSSAGEASP